MAKRHNTSTSKAAYDSVRDHVIPSHHAKILEALSVMGEGIYEEIALKCGFSNANTCSRRLKEMLDKGLIVKTERTKNTSTGRKAFIYRLKPQNSANDWLSDGTEVLDGEKWLGVKDDAPKIVDKNTDKSYQPSLF